MLCWEAEQGALVLEDSQQTQHPEPPPHLPPNIHTNAHRDIQSGCCLVGRWMNRPSPKSIHEITLR